MCNPPFFESMEEAAQNPATAFGGTSAEMVCPGGELAFVQQMVQDSLSLRVRRPTSFQVRFVYLCQASVDLSTTKHEQRLPA